MADVYFHVEKALQERLEAFAELPADGVAYENVRYSPPSPKAGLAWFEAYFDPGETDRKTLGPNGYSRLDGGFQITLNFPKNTGSADARRAADKMVQWFKSGTRLGSGGVSFTCRKAKRSKRIPNDKWYRLPVKVDWYTHRTEL